MLFVKTIFRIIVKILYQVLNFIKTKLINLSTHSKLSYFINKLALLKNKLK